MSGIRKDPDGVCAVQSTRGVSVFEKGGNMKENQKPDQVTLLATLGIESSKLGGIAMLLQGAAEHPFEIKNSLPGIGYILDDIASTISDTADELGGYFATKGA